MIKNIIIYRLHCLIMLLILAFAIIKLFIVMIPNTYAALVEKALQEKFGVRDWEAIYPISSGLSTALVYRIVVKGKSYLLKIITRTDEKSDPSYEYECLRIVAAAGLAPALLYTNVTDKISITDFVEATAFPQEQARIQMPALLKKLHALPPLPLRLNYFEVLDGWIQKLKTGKIIPEHLTTELFRRFEKITAVYPRDISQWVNCHNDLKPENILFDGNKPVLVDWEAIFLNDPYIDLAVVSNFVIEQPEQTKAYLTHYFGYEPSEYQLARFILVQQIMHMAYFAFFMLIIAGAGNTIDYNTPHPGFREFHNDMWNGKIDLASQEARQQYAWTHYYQLLKNLESTAFEDALQVVSNYHLS
jgi:thiamine kinase-like enzyme